MKNLLLLIVVVLSSCDLITNTRTSKEKFNVEKDKMIIDLFNRGVDSFSYSEYCNTETFNIVFKELKIWVVHEKGVPYSNPDQWLYFGNYLDGRTLMLTTSTGVVKHQINPETLLMIRSYCINRKQNEK